MNFQNYKQKLASLLIASFTFVTPSFAKASHHKHKIASNQKDVSASDTVQSKPNIVFIMADDHAWQAVSAYKESRQLIRTPNIDRLASEGVRFDRCLVPNSLCGPSRAAILTGTYNHINGFYNNYNCRFDGSQITFPKLLQSAGYQTAVIGKWLSLIHI